jgi:hypothetical protein
VIPSHVIFKEEIGALGFKALRIDFSYPAWQQFQGLSKTGGESVPVTDNTKHPFRLQMQTTDFLREVTSTNTMSYLQSMDHRRLGHFKVYSHKDLYTTH